MTDTEEPEPEAKPKPKPKPKRKPKPVPKVALARKRRKALNTVEWLLWQRLKDRQDDGLVFRHEKPYGPYILDFFCFKARLVIEVDGYVHSEPEQAAHDAVRDAYLRDCGLEIYRLPASEVYRDADGAADGIRLLAAELAAQRERGK